MEKIWRVIKNWWVTILFAAGAIADHGFGAIKPLLIEAGIDEGIMSYLHLFMFLFAIVKAKTELPTQSPEKLQDLANKKYFEKRKEANGFE